MKITRVAWALDLGSPLYPEVQLLRIYLLRCWVNKDHHAPLSLLVNEEHTLAKLESCGLHTGLGVQIFGPTFFEVLVGFGKLAGVKASRALGSTTTLLIALPRLRRTEQISHRLIGSADGNSLR